MLIKMKTNIAGPDGNASAGKIINMPEKVAVNLVTNGYAEYAEPEPKQIKKIIPEKAIIEPSENAAIMDKKKAKAAEKKAKAEVKEDK